MIANIAVDNRKKLYIGFGIFLAVSFCLRLIGFADAFPVFMCIVWTLYLSCTVILLSARFRAYKWSACINVTYLMRLLLLLYNMASNNSIDVFFKNVDWVKFTEVAHRYYEGDFSFFWTNYPRILYLQYQIFGENQYIVRVINVFLSILAIIDVCYILEYLQLKTVISKIVVWTVCFLPYPIIGSIMILREPFYISFCTFSLYFFLKWIDKRDYRDFIISIMLILLPVFLHSGHISVLIAYLAIFVLYGKGDKSSFLNFRLLLGIGILVIILLWANSGLGGHYLMIGSNGIINTIQALFTRAFRNGGGSFYLRWMQSPSSLLMLFIYTPIRMFYFLLSPLPGDFRGLVDVVTFLGDSFIHLLFLICFVALIIKKEKEGKKDHNEKIFAITVFFIVFFTALVFCWGTFTAGTAIRHREFLLYMECIVMGIYFKQRIS